MKRIIRIAAIVAALAVPSIAVVALAAEPAPVESVATAPVVVPDVGSDPLAFLGLVQSAVQGRQWALLGALVLCR